MNVELNKIYKMTTWVGCESCGGTGKTNISRRPVDTDFLGLSSVYIIMYETEPVKCTHCTDGKVAIETHIQLEEVK